MESLLIKASRPNCILICLLRNGFQVPALSNTTTINGEFDDKGFRSKLCFNISIKERFPDARIRLNSVWNMLKLIEKQLT